MLVFNGHSDILSDVNRRRLNGEKKVFEKYHYENFLKSNVKAAILVIWTDPLNIHRTEDRTQEIIKSFKQDFKESSHIIRQVFSKEDLKFDDPKINILVGMEGLDHIGTNISLIEKYYYEIGLRHASLTWNEENNLASGISTKNVGLKKAGKEAIKEIERLGIILDVSHLNSKSFWDVIDVVNKPIIASHSNCESICNVKRNLTDNQIKAIASTGGLIGVNAISYFVNKNSNKKNIDGLIEHIEHIVELVGINHVAFGFDFCDFLPPSYVGKKDPDTNSTTIKKLSSESDIYLLINRLTDLGFSKDDIEKISYKNYLNLIDKIIK